MRIIRVATAWKNCIGAAIATLNHYLAFKKQLLRTGARDDPTQAKQGVKSRRFSQIESQLARSGGLHADSDLSSGRESSRFSVGITLPL
jgi:hypothetical protein